MLTNAFNHNFGIDSNSDEVIPYDMRILLDIKKNNILHFWSWKTLTRWTLLIYDAKSFIKFHPRKDVQTMGWKVFETPGNHNVFTHKLNWIWIYEFT